MARQIVIAFDAEPDGRSLTHQVRNFGEDLYHACKADGWATISIEDVDRATNELRVTVRSKRRLRRIVTMVEKLLEAHHLRSRAHLTAVAELE